MERTIKRSIQALIYTLQYGSKYDLNADQIFNWYISNKSLTEYVGTLRQREIEFEKPLR